MAINQKGVSRKEALKIVAGAGVLCTAALLLPREARAATKPTQETAEQPASALASSATSAATAEGNKTKKFADIPKDALITVKELHDLIEAGGLKKDGDLFVLDIRSHRDYQKAQIEGTRNIPAGRQIEIRIDEIPTDKLVVIIALKNTNRLAETYFMLLARGWDPELLRVLDGGVDAWKKAGYPTLANQFLGC